MKKEPLPELIPKKQTAEALEDARRDVSVFADNLLGAITSGIVLLEPSTNEEGNRIFSGIFQGHTVSFQAVGPLGHEVVGMVRNVLIDGIRIDQLLGLEFFQGVAGHLDGKFSDTKILAEALNLRALGERLRQTE